MSRPKENDFRKKIKDQLGKRVAYRCSNPDCRKPTIGPKSNSDDAVSTGKAAHICAASPGGARFDVNMASEQIRAFDNGIWLCATHADEIDLNYTKYPVELLKDWKNKAEKSAEDEKGNKLASNGDAVDTLLVAMGSSKKKIPHMIENIHRASSEFLEQLDPRFGVKSSYINQQTHFEIYPKENVSFKLVVHPKNPHEFLVKHSDFVKHGKDLMLDTNEIDVHGSDLLKEIFNQKGNLLIGSPKKDAVLKVWMKLPENQQEHFEDLAGKISLGREGFEFSGNSMGGMFEIKLKKTSLVDKKTDFNITLNLTKWNNFDVIRLPYFDKLKKLFDYLVDGNQFFIALDIEGERLFTSKSINIENNDYFQHIACYLTYADAVRTLANFTKQEIKFKSGHDFTAEDYADLLEIARIVEGKAIVRKEDIKSKITGDLTFESQDAIDFIKVSQEVAELKYVEQEGRELLIFEQKVQTPPRVAIYHSVTIRLIKKDKKIRVGEKVKVELVPTDDFYVSTIFDTSS